MATKPAQAPSTSSIATTSLIVLVLVNIMNFYDRHVGGALAEPLRREFGLTDTQIGWIGTIFTLLYAFVGLPLGKLADRVSRKKLLSAGVAVWGTLTAFAAWATSFPMLLVSRLGLAVGEAACAPTATSWIGDLFPPDRRSRPLALFMIGVPVGGALSFFFSGPIAQAFGWRRAMIVAAIPALLLAPVVLMLREPERGAAETHKPNDNAVQLSPFLQRICERVERLLSPFLLKHSRANRMYRLLVREILPILGLLCIPAFWWIILSGALVNFNLYAIGTFLPAFMGRIHHLKVGPANIATGVVYATGGLLGGVLGGIWGDRIARRRPDGRMLIAAGAALVAVPLSYFGVRQPLGALAPAIALLALAYGALNMYYGLVYASIQQFVAPALRGLAMSIYFLFMYLGGASFGPLLTGALSDKMAHRAAAAAGSAQVTEAFKAFGLQQAMLVIPVLSLLLALVLWAGSRSILRDSQAQQS